MQTPYFFFIGKGGVGKSTSSALSSVYFSEKKGKTLLVSMDPAHNQRDIFKIQFGEKPFKLTDKLSVIEIDVDKWIKRYLKQTEDHIKAIYSYQGSMSMHNYFSVLKYSPGIEEFALLLAFSHVIQTYRDYRCIVFDMPPTALTIKFFSLPFVTLSWLYQLQALRQQICQKKEIISKIQFGKKVIECDRVITRLERLIVEYGIINDIFLSDQVRINIVLNPDTLSFSESERIRDKLKEIGLKIYGVVVNKVREEDSLSRINKHFGTYNIVTLPHTAIPPLGFKDLKDLIKKTEKSFNLIFL